MLIAALEGLNDNNQDLRRILFHIYFSLVTQGLIPPLPFPQIPPLPPNAPDDKPGKKKH